VVAFESLREGELRHIADAMCDLGETEVGIAQKTTGDGHPPVGEMGTWGLADGTGEAVGEG
jgi:hypothetical protein